MTIFLKSIRIFEEPQQRLFVSFQMQFIQGRQFNCIQITWHMQTYKDGFAADVNEVAVAFGHVVLVRGLCEPRADMRILHLYICT